MQVDIYHCESHIIDVDVNYLVDKSVCRLEFKQRDIASDNFFYFLKMQLSLPQARVLRDRLSKVINNEVQHNLRSWGFETDHGN